MKPTTTTTTKPPGSSSTVTSPRRWMVLTWTRDIVFVIILTLYGAALLLDYSYNSYVQPLVESYRRSTHREADDDFFPDFDNDFTYYHRHCSKLDISTTSSTDLLVQPDMTSQQAGDLMLKHGAVALRDVLDNTTVSELRNYLASRHAIRHTLSWNEVFWDGEYGTRLSLGIGTQDHPAIQKALEQIGSHDLVRRTVQGILGDDPAIVELSTLTSLSGAHDQGMHSDTDWFGSSLEYARTFLHSYSFFVALQDTPQELGATTVCPGTHYCADEDLESVCLSNGAFSVSTNGYTGPEHGLLRKGDAFIFNQNVWHRGPKVQDVDDSHTDRIMFILTFVSRNKASPSDHRQLGLGTYYYQRWNMWGATLDYLKDAGKAMVQPLAGLRALGLYHPPGRNIGLYWWETFCQQMANREYFYEPYELGEFKRRVLDEMNVPRFLSSTSDEWETFIPESIRRWIQLLADGYLMLCLFCISVWLFSGPASDNHVGYEEITPKHHHRTWRLLWIHVALGCLFHVGLYYVDHTQLAKSVPSGDIFAKPFPAPPSDTTTNTVGPSAFPERNDVLVATRFDAEFLASYDRFLNNHPGNKEWQAKIKLAAANLPLKLHQSAAQIIVSTMIRRQREFGYPASRFLWQDPSTGSWRVMSKDNAVEETRRAIMANANSSVGRSWQSLKYLLAEARFGASRNANMSQNIVPYFVHDLMDAMFDVGNNPGLRNDFDVCYPDENAGGTLAPDWQDAFEEFLLAEFPEVTKDSNKAAGEETKKDKSIGNLQVGDLVWVREKRGLEWHEATLLEAHDGGHWWSVNFLSDSRGKVESRQIRPYFQVKEGDRVAVDFNGDSTQFYSGTIVHVKASGRCSILFDDGYFEANIRRQHLVSLPQ